MELQHEHRVTRWKVVDYKQRGTLLQLWITNETDADDEDLMLLEVSFNWVTAADVLHDTKHVPTFESACLSNPEGESTKYVNITEKELYNMVGDWADLIR